MGSQQSTIPPPDTQPDEQEALRSAAPNEATPQQIESPSRLVHRHSDHRNSRRRELSNYLPLIPSSLISRAAQNRGQIVTSEGLVVHSSGSNPIGNSSAEEDGPSSHARAQALRVLRRLRSARDAGSSSSQATQPGSSEGLRRRLRRRTSVPSRVVEEDESEPMDMDISTPQLDSRPSASGSSDPASSQEAPETWEQYHTPPSPTSATVDESRAREARTRTATDPDSNPAFRAMLEAFLSSMDARTPNPASASNPETNSATQPPAIPDFSELLNATLAQSAAGAGPQNEAAAEPSTSLRSPFLRAIRDRIRQRTVRPGRGSRSTHATLPGPDASRTPIPVLILIGRSSRDRTAGANRAAGTNSQTRNAGDSSATSSAEPSSRSRGLFGEFSSDSAPSASVGPSSTGIPGGLGISDTSEPTAENANTSAEGTGATPPADLSPAEAEALARRSMSFMIYFIPSEAGAAAGGLPTQTGTQTGAPTAQTNQGSGHPLGPGQPPSGSLRDALSEIAVLPSLFGEASSPSQGASNSTQATATAGNARQPGTASSDPPTGGAASPHTHRILPMQMQVSPRPARNIVEELAISIMLQIVTNMLREGSMNGPGGLLGGTLSLDIADELAMEDGAAGGGTGAGMPAGGGGMSYEDFLRLAELLGPARPRNATMDDVDRELPVFKFSDNSQVSMDIDGPPPLEPVEEDKGKGRKTETETEMETQEDKPTESSRRVSLRIEDLVPATREKCMICLSPYEADDEIRVMGCRHGFHKPCLDQWLTQYVNSCPLCREKAVSTTPTAPTTTTPTTPQTPFNPFTPLGRPPTSDEPLPFSVDTSRQTQDQTPPERRGFLRRIWEMFGSGGRNPAGGAPANANAGVDAGQTEGMERGTGLPAAVLVVLG